MAGRPLGASASRTTLSRTRADPHLSLSLLHPGLPASYPAGTVPNTVFEDRLNPEYERSIGGWNDGCIAWRFWQDSSSCLGASIPSIGVSQETPPRNRAGIASFSAWKCSDPFCACQPEPKLLLSRLHHVTKKRSVTINDQLGSISESRFETSACRGRETKRQPQLGSKCLVWTLGPDFVPRCP